MNRFLCFRVVALLCVVTFSLSLRAEVNDWEAFQLPEGWNSEVQLNLPEFDNSDLLAQNKSRSKSGKRTASNTKGLNPPFEFTAEKLENTFFVINNEYVEFPKKRTTIVCKVHPGGQISGTYKVIEYQYLNVTYFDYTPEEYVPVDREISGKWSTSYRSLGEGREKCYAIDLSFLKSTLYLPSSGQYLFQNWINCEDNNTGNAYTVLSKKNL